MVGMDFYGLRAFQEWDPTAYVLAIIDYLPR